MEYSIWVIFFRIVATRQHTFTLNYIYTDLHTQRETGLKTTGKICKADLPNKTINPLITLELFAKIFNVLSTLGWLIYLQQWFNSKYMITFGKYRGFFIFIKCDCKNVYFVLFAYITFKLCSTYVFFIRPRASCCISSGISSGIILRFVNITRLQEHNTQDVVFKSQFYSLTRTQLTKSSRRKTHQRRSHRFLAGLLTDLVNEHKQPWTNTRYCVTGVDVAFWTVEF